MGRLGKERMKIEFWIFSKLHFHGPSSYFKITSIQWFFGTSTDYLCQRLVIGKPESPEVIFVGAICAQVLVVFACVSAICACVLGLFAPISYGYLHSCLEVVCTMCWGYLRPCLRAICMHDSGLLGYSCPYLGVITSMPLGQFAPMFRVIELLESTPRSFLHPCLRAICTYTSPGLFAAILKDPR